MRPHRIRGMAEQMSPEDAVAWLLDFIEQSLPECNPAGLDNLMAWGFCHQEARLLASFLATGPRTARAERLSMIASLNGELLSGQHVRTLISGIRKRLAALGWPVQIVSVYGVGYRTTVPTGWDVPMAAAPLKTCQE